jgi:hypothetical protein
MKCFFQFIAGQWLCISCPLVLQLPVLLRGSSKIDVREKIKFPRYLGNLIVMDPNV